MTKIKLPEVVKLIDQNRENFNEKLVLNNISIKNEINVIIQTVDASLKQSLKNLSSNDKKEIKKGEFKHEVRQFQKPYDNQQAEQISLMV